MSRLNGREADLISRCSTAAFVFLIEVTDMFSDSSELTGRFIEGTVGIDGCQKLVALVRRGFEKG